MPVSGQIFNIFCIFGPEFGIKHAPLLKNIATLRFPKNTSAIRIYRQE